MFVVIVLVAQRFNKLYNELSTVKLLKKLKLSHE